MDDAHQNTESATERLTDSHTDQTAHPGCPFCGVPQQERMASSAHGFALRDRYPVSPGHTLVVPERHVTDLFDLTPPEQAALWALVADVRGALARELGPDGFNIGVNAGAAAGQTVPHAHIHVIPRYAGDVEDPRGGVRGVIPDRVRYGEGEP